MVRTTQEANIRRFGVRRFTPKNRLNSTKARRACCCTHEDLALEDAADDVAVGLHAVDGATDEPSRVDTGNSLHTSRSDDELAEGDGPQTSRHCAGLQLRQ